MSKRQFRSQVAQPSHRDDPDYPTLESFDAQRQRAERFDGSRRSFLTRLGLAFLGAGTVAAGLAGCGDRVVGGQPDQGVGPSGAAPAPDAQIDLPALPRPDGELAGAAPMPDARVDPQEDMGPIAGGAPMPPSKLDAGPPDQYATAGEPPMPDARVDGR